jgi:hypothetical protein
MLSHYLYFERIMSFDTQHTLLRPVSRLHSLRVHSSVVGWLVGWLVLSGRYWYQCPTKHPTTIVSMTPPHVVAAGDGERLSSEILTYRGDGFYVSCTNHNTGILQKVGGLLYTVRGLVENCVAMVLMM